MKCISLIAISLSLSFCSDNSGQSKEPLQEIADLGFEEVSGLEYINGKLWAQEDSGNANKIYALDYVNDTEVGTTITNAQNHDWEDLAADAEGNLYIGDFGNNDNERKDLAIYKLAANDFSTVAYTVSFYYPEQTDFPPKKSNLIFDCEAFIEHNGNFYLFTKNRSKNFDGTFSIYKVPNTPGNHAAQLMGTKVSCDNFNKCAITGADISPDGTKVALISGANVWMITDFGADDFAHAPMQKLELGNTTQKEGICFKDNDTLLIADEKDKKTGGKLYQLKLSALKAKL